MIVRNFSRATTRPSGQAPNELYFSFLTDNLEESNEPWSQASYTANGLLTGLGLWVKQQFYFDESTA